jgi:hypothetical protein
MGSNITFSCATSYGAKRAWALEKLCLKRWLYGQNYLGKENVDLLLLFFLI